MTALFEVTETDDDDSFTTCQGCDKIFDNEDRLPLNLDCQHSMCITCIKVSHFDNIFLPGNFFNVAVILTSFVCRGNQAKINWFIAQHVLAGQTWSTERYLISRPIIAC